jgi:CTP-dependent riboflavin kinase
MAKKGGVFCEIYGCSIKNLILEYLMENHGLDFAIGDLARYLDISRPKAYQLVYEFEKKGYVKKSRVVGRTQLFILNGQNKRVKLLLNNFEECLKVVLDEHDILKNKTGHSRVQMPLSATVR